MYFIKVVGKAKEGNPNFSGMSYEAIYGKGEEKLQMTGNYAEAAHVVKNTISEWEKGEYGYKRECDAKRSWIYKNSEKSKYWEDEEISIIWID